MIVVNKIKDHIPSHHRRGIFLAPGSNDIDEASLTHSEREYIAVLVKHGIVEVVDSPPESSVQVIPEPDPIVAPMKKRRTRARRKKAAHE